MSNIPPLRGEVPHPDEFANFESESHQLSQARSSHRGHDNLGLSAHTPNPTAHGQFQAAGPPLAADPPPYVPPPAGGPPPAASRPSTLRERFAGSANFLRRLGGGSARSAPTAGASTSALPESNPPLPAYQQLQAVDGMQGEIVGDLVRGSRDVRTISNSHGISQFAVERHLKAIAKDPHLMAFIENARGARANTSYPWIINRALEKRA
jgi:hypothetical protein